MWLIIICVVILLLIIFIKSKVLATDSILLINGPVGSGKSSTSLQIVKNKMFFKRIKYYTRKYFLDYVLHPIKFLKNPKERIKEIKSREKPYIYSNVPLYKMEYIPIEIDILKRQNYRFNYDSILYLNEASLIANSMSYKDDEINQGLTLFVKLIRHEMRGSGLCMVLDTQSPNDLHYSADRSINQGLFIEKSIGWLPFVRLIWVREMAINRPDVKNVYVDDVKEDSSLRFILVWKSIFKNFDSHCYSILTDNLPPLRSIKKKQKKTFTKKRFFIPTWLKFKEIDNNNELFKKECLGNEAQENRKDNT